MTNQTCPKLLAECIASGQVSAAQVEAHRVLDAAIAQPVQRPLPGMSEMNRAIAYCAAAKLREIGYEWDGKNWIALPEQTATKLPPLPEAVEQAIDAYWCHGYGEGKTGIENGTTGNAILAELVGAIRDYARAAIAQPEQQTPIRQPLSDRDDAWFTACLEIIERCVASDMYGNARALLNKAYDAATPSIAQPEQLNDFTLVPAGWKLVPVEPSDAMIAAGKRETHGNRGALEKTKRIYAEMLRTVSLQNVQPEQPAPVRQPMMDEQIDTAYRLVWSTVPHAQRLTAFARAIEAKITGAAHD